MWSVFILSSSIGLASLWSLILFLHHGNVRALLAYWAPLSVLVACGIFAAQLNPFARLALSGLVLLGAFKGSSLLLMPLDKVRAMNRFGLVFYSTAWPGIDPGPFATAPIGMVEDGKRYGRGMTKAILGVLSFLLVAGFSPQLGETLSSWLGIACLLTIFHLGLTDCLTEVTQTIGWLVKPLFESPFRSSSLSNFWSQRWNRPFVELNKLFFLPWLVRKFGMRVAIFVIFLISGFLQDRKSVV